MLLISATDHGSRRFSCAGRSEPHTDRLVVVGVLVMTLGALALGLVFASRTTPAGAVRTDVLPAAPSPAPQSSVPGELRPLPERGELRAADRDSPAYTAASSNLPRPPLPRIHSLQ